MLGERTGQGARDDIQDVRGVVAVSPRSHCGEMLSVLQVKTSRLCSLKEARGAQCPSAGPPRRLAGLQGSRVLLSRLSFVVRSMSQCVRGPAPSRLFPSWERATYRGLESPFCSPVFEASLCGLRARDEGPWCLAAVPQDTLGSRVLQVDRPLGGLRAHQRGQHWTGPASGGIRSPRAPPSPGAPDTGDLLSDLSHF